MGCRQHTGTFFCDRTTAQSLPRTPIAMMFAAVIALKAYSVDTLEDQLLCYISGLSRHESRCSDVDSFARCCCTAIGDGESWRLAGGFFIPTWYNLPCSEKIVMCLSMPVPI